jgi:hypothetical protein
MPANRSGGIPYALESPLSVLQGHLPERFFPASFRYHVGEMSISPFPAPLQPIAGRRFSFYPPVHNVDRNEWMYRRATWSECVVVNTATGEEFSVPRSFLGEITTGNGLTVVALHRELESRDGTLCPVRRPVIELPVAVNDVPRTAAASHRLAPVVNIRLEQRPEWRISKRLGVALVLGAVACTICADIVRQVEQRADLARLTRPYLQLSAEDDYFAAVHKLGSPRADSVVMAGGGRVYRVLDYGARRYKVVLMGPSRSDALYIGALAADGRIVDAVRLGNGNTSDGLLRSMPPF